MLSRNPIAALPMVDKEQAVECTICFILKGAPLSLEMVAHETAKDAVLLQVIREIETFWKSPTRAPETASSIVSTQSAPSDSKIHVASNRYPLRRNYFDPKNYKM